MGGSITGWTKKWVGVQLGFHGRPENRLLFVTHTSKLRLTLQMTMRTKAGTDCSQR